MRSPLISPKSSPASGRAPRRLGLERDHLADHGQGAGGNAGLGCPTARRGIRCDFRRCDRRQSPSAVRSQTGRSSPASGRDPQPRSASASTDTATCSDCGPAPAVRAPNSSMSVLTDIRNRGTRDVFFLVCDGLKGLPEAALERLAGHDGTNVRRAFDPQHLSALGTSTLGRTQTRSQTDLHGPDRGCRECSVRRSRRPLGQAVSGDHPIVDQRLAGIHPVPRLRHRDTASAVLHQRD